MKTILFAILFLISCKGKDHFVEGHIKTSESFIACLEQNDANCILAYCYPEVDLKISDPASRKFHVSKAHALIKSYGLPPQVRWIKDHDPENNFERLTVTDPLGPSSLLIVFPPPEISEKVYKFEIVEEYESLPTAPVSGPRPLN